MHLITSKLLKIVELSLLSFMVKKSFRVVDRSLSDGSAVIFLGDRLHESVVMVGFWKAGCRDRELVVIEVCADYVDLLVASALFVQVLICLFQLISY